MAGGGGFSLLLALAVLLAGVSQLAMAAETPPAGVSIGAPPFDSRFTCSIDPAIGVAPEAICTPTTDLPQQIVLSYDNDVVSARYQYKTPVQLWKKGSAYVASFLAYFAVNFDRFSEYTVRELFGGGLAFAFTPSLSGAETGPESFGLFPVDQKTRASLNGAATKTVAVEVDLSRAENDGFDPAVPHIGLDINSVKSVKTKYLGDPATIIDVKIGVWIEYNAVTKTIKVYTHKVKATETPRRQNASVAITYVGLELAKEVNESSYVGFGSRVPQAPNGVYRIHDFKFSTAWVLGSTVNY